MNSPLITSGAVSTSKAWIKEKWVDGGIVVKDGHLQSYGETAGKAGLAIPGFIDLQVNGHGGVDLLSCQSRDEIRKISQSLYRQGVIGYLPTLITGPINRTLTVMGLIEEVRREHKNGEAKILGIHLEGPFISPEKPGVHPLEHFALPDMEMLGRYLRAGSVCIMTIAPELPGALEMIKYLTGMGITVSLGHSNATAAQAHAGFDAGAKTVTHLWNAMPPLTARDPGLVGVALERDDVMIQIIVDRVHLAPEIIETTLAAAMDRFIVTNDALAPAGQGDGVFPFGTIDITVKDQRALRDDGTIAGGVGSLHGSLQQLREMKVPLESGLASMSSRPAGLIGQESAGILDMGTPVQLIMA